jgi:hypothetical protein
VTTESGEALLDLLARWRKSGGRFAHLTAVDRHVDDREAELGIVGTYFFMPPEHPRTRKAYGFSDQIRAKALGDVIYANAYAKVWPKATMILLVRDPRDHALSVMKLNEQRASRGQPNFYDDYAAVAHGWRETIGEGLEAIRTSGLRHVVVRYEDLVREPDEELRRLSDNLNIDLSAGRDFYKADFIAEHTTRFKHHDNLKQPINKGSLEKWRTEMSDADIAIFAEIAGPLMQRYGYPLR